MTLRPVLVFVSVLTVAIGCGSGDPGPDGLRTGRGVYADNCSACHGNRGQGGVGPALSEVLAVWPSCTDQMTWIRLGSERWQQEHGPTYGALDRPIDNVMPGYEGDLSDAEIAAVAAFERVEYGGGDPDTELDACGVSP